jgi:CubicO group peptidase (beta-lactamase class C family)
VKKHGKTFRQKALAVALMILAFASTTREADAAARARGPTDEQREFASFVDGFMAGVRKEREIPGMAFVAVKDGEVLYLKGYGAADLESGKPVDPERTMFRIGEISQAITAVAVMQLAERGRVGLDEDVNTYLRRWKIPGSFKNPVTPRHLMTHTAGLDYKELEVAAPTSADERSYASKLPKLMPGRVEEPGSSYRESGMGYALLGSIVERYSRMSFDAAIKKYAFAPLGMTDSAFSVTPGDLAKLATGYGADYRPIPYEYRYDLPARGMSSTARDMGRFITAQLAGGVIGRNRVLGDMHARSIMRRHFSPHPMINGTGLGYLERPVNGLRTLRRCGNAPGFSSFIMLIPEKNFGLFMAVNVSGMDFGDEMARSVVERFFQPALPRVAPTSLGMKVYPDIEGYYRTNKISRLTAERILSLTSSQIKISIRDDCVTAGATGGGETTRWLPAGSDDLFRRITDGGDYADEYMFFRRGESGDVTSLTIGDVSNTYDRVKPPGQYYAQWAVMLGFAATALLSFAGLLAGSALNKGRFPWESGFSSDTELWSIAVLFWAVQATFVCGLAVSASLYGDSFKIFVPYQVKALFVIPLAGALLLAWFWFRVLTKLFSPEHHWLEKTAITVVALIETGYVLFLAQWKLLGFMF